LTTSFIVNDDPTRSPKAANTQQFEEESSVCNDKQNEINNQTNEFPSTFNYGSFEVMKKQLSFLQEQLEQEKKKRIELEMRHSQSDQFRSTSKPTEVNRSVPSTNN